MDRFTLPSSLNLAPTTAWQGEGRWRDSHSFLASAVARAAEESSPPFLSACLALAHFFLCSAVVEGDAF